MGHVPDEGQEGVRWLSLRELATARLYPAVLKQVLAATTKSRMYLGDVN